MSVGLLGKSPKFIERLVTLTPKNAEEIGIDFLSANLQQEFHQFIKQQVIHYPRISL